MSRSIRVLTWVGVDGGVDGIGLRGLPEQWKVLLKSSNISKDMAMRNKEALVDCFTYMEEQAKQAPLPKMEDFIEDLRQGGLLVTSMMRSFLYSRGGSSQGVREHKQASGRRCVGHSVVSEGGCHVQV